MKQETTFEDFKILKKLGEGAYGKVYQVKKKSSGEIFAMKELQVSNMKKDELANTLNEIRILCSFNHKYICGYEEAFLSAKQDRMFIIMEYVGGGDLASKIQECKKRNMRIQEKSVWMYLCQALIGLEALHKSKIIHRDIKAANLFLSSDFETVKLGDLGVAKHAKNDMARTQIGTPYYLAPEIWDNKPYDYRCDIFSLGVLVYEMAALRVPFQGVSLQDLYKKIKRGIIQKIPSNYSDELYQMIQLMLSQDPRKRPTASSLLSNSIIKQKLIQFGMVNLDELHQNMGQLMETIILPKQLKNLQNNLPKKRKGRANSCQKLTMLSSGDSQDLDKYRHNLNMMLKERKQVLEESKKNNIPPTLKSPPLKSKPKVVPNKFSDPKKEVMSYKDYLESIAQKRQERQERGERNHRRFQSAEKRY